jgi:hypothetical protein
MSITHSEVKPIICSEANFGLGDTEVCFGLQSAFYSCSTCWAFSSIPIMLSLFLCGNGPSWALWNITALPFSWSGQLGGPTTMPGTSLRTSNPEPKSRLARA